MEEIKICGCHKILPLVYDESLSYYEAISKLRQKVNELIVFTNEKLDEIVREKLDDLFISAMYDPQTENITLILGEE